MNTHATPDRPPCGATYRGPAERPLTRAAVAGNSNGVAGIPPQGSTHDQQAYLFVLSLEQATGQRSAWLKGRAIGDSLDFPMRFTPHPGCDCSFGDVNHWSPLPFHFAMARRLKRTQTLALLVPGSRPTPLSIQTDPRAGMSITLGAKRGHVLRFKTMGANLTFGGR